MLMSDLHTKLKFTPIFPSYFFTALQSNLSREYCHGRAAAIIFILTFLPMLSACADLRSTRLPRIDATRSAASQAPTSRPSHLRAPIPRSASESRAIPFPASGPIVRAPVPATPKYIDASAKEAKARGVCVGTETSCAHREAAEAPPPPGGRSARDPGPLLAPPPPAPPPPADFNIARVPLAAPKGVRVLCFARRTFSAWQRRRVRCQKNSLEQNGYVERSFFRTAAGGVAMVTRLERVNEDGSSYSGDGRWPASPSTAGLDTTRNLIDVLRGLFFVDRGHYKSLFLYFRSLAFTQSTQKISEGDARALLYTGTNVLPPNCARPYGESRCTVLIYEFASDGAQVQLVESHLTGRDHLQRAGVLSLLQSTK